jgi:hypothetical protein
MGIYSLCDVMVYTKDKTRNTELQAGLDNFRKHIPQREKTQNNEKKTYRKKTKTSGICFLKLSSPACNSVLRVLSLVYTITSHKE